MPSVRGVRFDPNREGLAGLRDCCLLTEAHPLEQIPGWHYVSARRTKMSKEERWRGGGRPGQGYPLAWYMVESEPAPHRCDGIWASLHSLSISLPPFFLFRPDPLSLFPFFTTPTLLSSHIETHAHAIILSHCNSCCSSAVFPGETN